MINLAVRAAALLVLAVVCASPQTPFRQLHVAAFDKTGQVVTDLTGSDLKVTDDGKPQPILFLRFNHDRPAASAQLGPHEYSNQSAPRQRRIILLLDLLNGSYEDRFTENTIVRALESAEDPAAIYFYILTNKATFYAVHALPENPASGAPPDNDWTAQAKPLLDGAIGQVFGLKPADERIAGNRDILTYQALRALGSAAAALPGPTSIVWVTYGFPMLVNLGARCRDVKVEDMIAKCNYPYVDFTPVVQGLGTAMARAGIVIWTVDEALALDSLSRSMLETFSGLTGGKTLPRGQTSAAVADAFAAMRSNYTLAYRPPEANWNGKFHRVKVTCARKDVEIRAEDGYFADPPRDFTAGLMEAAADSPAIGVRATASRGNIENRVRFDVSIGMRDLLLVPEEGRLTGEVVLEFVGLGDAGPVQLAKPNDLKLTLSAARLEAPESGAGTTTELAVPESVREVRIIAMDRWSGQVGSLTVPKCW
jgi:VWFA-related protein